MKTLLFALCLSVMSSFALAEDSWDEKVYESGELIYKSGFEQYLIVGKRGFGFSYAITGAADNFGDEVTIRIDKGQSEKIRVSKVGTNTFLISSNPVFIARIAKAKRIELDYRMCFTNQLCGFSETGGSQNAVWRFDTPLAEKFKDYLKFWELK